MKIHETWEQKWKQARNKENAAAKRDESGRRISERLDEPIQEEEDREEIESESIASARMIKEEKIPSWKMPDYRYHDEEIHKSKNEDGPAVRRFTGMRKEILLEIVIDGTFSFSTIYSVVFYMLEQLIASLEHKKEEYKGAVIKYGLTVFHEEAEPVTFSDGEYFTESEKEFLDELRNIKFFGGSVTGREDLNGAIDQALCILNNYGMEKNCNRGLLMFSDSLPEEDDMTPDFTSEEQGEYINKGLRFAAFYTFSSEFMPQLLIVDGNGDIAENGRNTIIFGDIHNILSESRGSLLERIHRMVTNILNQTSVR